MRQSLNTPSWRILPIADQAVCVDFGEVIDEQINQRVTALAARVRGAALTGVLSLIPTYRALTVAYDSTQIRQTQLVAQLQELLRQPDAAGQRAKCWTIPVSYGGEHGVDLADLAALHHLTPQQVIDLHSAALYRVYMIGFMPGFAYLGGLVPRLHTSRRESPRLKTPAGSISIGGMQTAVGSVEAPSGWHLIGRTPVRSFVPDREQPFLFSAGDRIRFTPVCAGTFTRLQAQGDYLPDWTWQ
ncbi:Allophanate hydrolase subunit 1 [Sodalis praecaptivus]|uniref:Allophanate hydrolase subunit 1 n=1 Tax=Sodalis praecaptivus TaxID=1239307 RepID=W0HSN9_9GAMM|nr:5-oxoprolinase subunit PxpB [Sodalis praecaptivus]AHF76804.1 Allophanate hydrolase subunit 1 [Sodalis praecaptivus]